MINERIALGMPSLPGYEIFSALEKAEELGFQSIMSLPGGPNTRHSLGEFPTLNFYEGTRQYRAKLKDALSRFKNISIHQAWDTSWQEWINCADYFGAGIVTVHVPASKSGPEQYQVPYFRKIGDYASNKGIRIGIENVGGRYAEYVNLVKSIDHPAVGATIDVGHCAYFEEVKSIADLDYRVNMLNQTLCRLVNDLREKVYHFHLHNVRKADWRDHRSIPDGVIDFTRLFEAIRGIEYSGLFDIELEEPEIVKKSYESGVYFNSLGIHSLGPSR